MLRHVKLCAYRYYDVPRKVQALYDELWPSHSDVSSMWLVARTDTVFCSSVLGIVTYSWDDEGVRIHRIGVAQAHRGRGIATALITHMQEADYGDSIYVVLNRRSSVAIHLFEKCGFTVRQYDKGRNEVWLRFNMSSAS